MNKNWLWLSIFLLGSSMGYAQKNSSVSFEKFINSSFLKKHLTIIASDEMEGRETGTEGQRKAAAYIEHHFKQIGLQAPAQQKGYQQMYPLHQDSLLGAQLQIGDYAASLNSDFLIPRNNDLKMDVQANGIVFAGYGIEDEKYNDYTNLDVKGKFVIFFLGEPKIGETFLLSGSSKSTDWSFPGIPKKLAIAKQKGAVGAMVLVATQPEFSERSIRNSSRTGMYFPRNTEDEESIPYVMISHAMATSLLGDAAQERIATAKKNEIFSVKQAWQTQSKTRFSFQKHRTVIEASNVLGIVEGTDKKDEYIVVTAHYDHLGIRNGQIYYGADDDGSGTVGVMAMAEAFAKAKAAGKGPRRTMVFMTVSGEEKGLWGSEYYSENPVYPLEKTSVNLNIDMVGRIDTERNTADTLNYVYVVGHNKLSSELPIINEAANNKYTKLVLDYKYDDPNDRNRIYYRSDHYNFARKGVPVLFFYDGMLKADYHKPTDTVDKINWPLYEKRVRMIFHTAWDMANRENMLIRDIPL